MHKKVKTTVKWLAVGPNHEASIKIKKTGASFWGRKNVLYSTDNFLKKVKYKVYYANVILKTQEQYMTVT